MALRQSIRWRSLEHGGLEEFHITEMPSGRIMARSVVVGQAANERRGVFYQIILRADWTLEAIMLEPTDERQVVLMQSADTRWRGSQGGLPELAGCIDIDFEMTPFTNTLPIRRAPLALGETRRFRMAYIPADTLEPFPAEQIYTRLSERVYRFETADGSFTADITVDEDGLVVDYPGLFERV